jgi:chromosome segregation ATPase
LSAKGAILAHSVIRDNLRFQRWAPQSFLYIRFDSLVLKGEMCMPVELPEDSPDAAEKKWRYRKPGEQIDEPIPEPEEQALETPEPEPEEQALETPEAEPEPQKQALETPEPEPEEETVEEPESPIEEEPLEDPMEESTEPVEAVDETVQLRSEIADLEAEIKQAKTENKGLTKQVSDLLSQADELNEKENALNEQIGTLTEQLDQAKTNLTERQKELTELKAKFDKLKKSEEKLSKAKEKLDDDYKTLEETAKEREEHLLGQLEGMAEQIGKLRELVRKRDEELVALQKDILVKKDLAQDAQTEVSKLRTVDIVKTEAVQDTTVLRRRVTDLEVELEQLKKALEKDPKYRIYMLVRETGQRTLEELSKILGVGVYEARRRVQELVRAGLLELKGEAVKVSRKLE